MHGRTRSEPTPVLSEWRWESPPHRVARPEAVLAARGRLAASLRAGHGLGVNFEVRLVGGPVPALTLGCTSSTTARWVSRVLLPAYGRSAWIRHLPQTEGPRPDAEWGRRVRPWPEPLRDATDSLSAMGGLALALTGVPPDLCVRWQFSPIAATWRRGVAHDVPPTPVLPPGSRAPFPRTVSAPRVGFGPERETIPLFWRARVSIEFPAQSPSAAISRSTARSVIENALRSGRGNGVRFSSRWLGLPWWERWFAVAEDELACVLPNANSDELLRADAALEGSCVLPLGRTDAGLVVGPPIEPGQGRHVAILGETGMGKSATLVAIARRASKMGGVVLLDPLGETARSFVQGLSAKESQERVIQISPEGPSAGINALEGVGGEGLDPVLSDRRLNDLVHALRRVRSGRYTEKFWGPRIEEMVTRALSAAARFPAGTLTEAHTLLATGGRTRQVVPPETRDAVRELSDRVRERPEDAEGARRLLYEVVRSPVLRRMLCDPEPRLHTKELVAPGRISVISGDASRVGETTARYLLAVYLALIWSELLARPLPSKTFVLLDECQWFSHDSLAEMLRLARRKNVHVVLATQTIGSLPEGVSEAVWTNVSDFVAFRGSPEEARELERATSALSMEEILSLPRGHAAVLLGKGNSVAWVRTSGRPWDPLPEPTGPDDPTAGARGSPSGRETVAVPVAPTTEDVLEWVRSRVSPSAHVVRVPLEEIRRSVDPDGKAVRDAGAVLSRAGALISSGRSSGGSIWTVDTTKIPAPPESSEARRGGDGAPGPISRGCATGDPPRGGAPNEEGSAPTVEGVGSPRKPS